MTEPTTIDLGLYHAGRDPSRELGPRRWPGWPRLGRTGARRWLPAALAAMMVASLAGGRVPVPPALTPVWTVPGLTDGSLVGEDDLYAMEQTDQGWALTSRRLAGGTPRWATPLDDALDDWYAVRLAGGVPLVLTAGPDGEETAGFDPATGRPSWRVRGWPIRTLVGGRVLLVRELPRTGPAPPDGQIPGGSGPYQLVAVDTRTGRAAFGLPMASGERLFFDAGAAGGSAGAAHLVTLDPDGLLTRVDLTTGEVSATAQTPPPPEGLRPVLVGGTPLRNPLSGDLLPLGAPPGAGANLSYSEVVDGLLVLPGDGERGPVAYDADTLAPLWSAPAGSWAAPCGPVVCSGPGSFAGPLTGRDPATGEILWSRECDSQVGGGQECALLPVPLAADGPLLVRRSPVDQGRSAVVRVVDAATGKTIIEMEAAWRLAGRGAGGSWILARPETAPADRPGAPAQRVWLGRLATDPVSFQVLGPVEAQWCMPHGEYLLCLRAPGEHTVLWRIQ